MVFVERPIMRKRKNGDRSKKRSSNSTEANGYLRVLERLRAISGKNRFLILCQLLAKERSVSELEALLKLNQPRVSQSLMVLRSENLVKTRRSWKQIFYSINRREMHEVFERMIKDFGEKGSVQ